MFKPYYGLRYQANIPSPNNPPIHSNVLVGLVQLFIYPMESPSIPTVCGGSRKTLIQVVFVCLYDEHTVNSLFGAHQNVWPILILKVQAIVMGQG